MTSALYNLCCLLLLATLRASAQLVQDAQGQSVSELERLYFDDSPAGFFSGIKPCTLYFDPSVNNVRNDTGRQTSAEWIRTAFHDFVTADVAKGIGGLDASIAYETHRSENVGVAFNDSIFFFQFFYSERVSMADLVALGAVVAVGHCGGPNIPFRGGRIDATGPGPTGVCEPETDLKTTLGDFARAGFSQQDAIALTACGHSMGGVHRRDFPNIVSANAVDVEGSDGRQDFDESVAVFDSQHVQNYLSGTGSRGGPLVTTANKSVQSDLRLFSSDNNRTIKSLAKSKDSFASTCTKLMARMLDTVPKGVSLTPQIKPSDAKPIALSLGINWNGTMSLSGTIRYMDIAASAPAPQNLDIALKGRNGRTSVPKFTTTTNLAVDNGTGVFGPTHRYPFTVNFPVTTGVSGLVVKGKAFALQDSIFVVTPLSSINPGLAAFRDQFKVQPFTFNITVAALLPKSPSSVKATFVIPRSQPGTLTPKIDRSTNVEIPTVGRVGPYAIFSTVQTFDLNVVNVFTGSLDIEAESLKTKLTFFKLSSLLK